MLKTIVATLIGAVVFQTGVLAQIYVKSTGVGIGTQAPAEKLHVAGKLRIDASDDVISLYSPANAWQYLAFNKGTGRVAYMGLNPGTDFEFKIEQPGHLFLTPSNGRVIIESIQDNGSIGGALTLRHPQKIGVTGEASEWTIYNMRGGYGASLQFWAYTPQSSSSVLTLTDCGNVGIGTMAPGYKLEVNGSLKSTTIQVDVKPNWPDYVFDSGYQLPSLTEIEKYLQQNHHLPEVPAAETVKKEGIDLADNQAVLLKKIEELTLYVIEQDKQIKQLEGLKKEVEALKAAIQQMQK